MARVLIAADSVLSRPLLRRVLEEDGHYVTEAEDAFVAVEHFLADRPELVFLDFGVSGASELEVLGRIRALDPRVRALVASDAPDAASWSTSVTTFIRRPFSAAEVVGAVAALLRRAGP